MHGLVGLRYKLCMLALLLYSDFSSLGGCNAEPRRLLGALSLCVLECYTMHKCLYQYLMPSHIIKQSLEPEYGKYTVPILSPNVHYLNTLSHRLVSINCKDPSCFSSFWPCSEPHVGKHVGMIARSLRVNLSRQTRELVPLRGFSKSSFVQWSA